jgi:hypothetical protein
MTFRRVCVSILRQKRRVIHSGIASVQVDECANIYTYIWSVDKPHFCIIIIIIIIIIMSLVTGLFFLALLLNQQ